MSKKWEVGLLETPLSCVVCVRRGQTARPLLRARFRAADSISLAHGASERVFVLYFNTEINALY